MRPAAALQYVRASKFTQDLLQEPLRNKLAAGDLRHPERTVTLVECELHQRSNRVLALLCEPQEITTCHKTVLQHIVSEVHRRRPPRGGLNPVGVHVAVQVLAHGVLDPLPGDQEDGTPTDVNTVVGDALQIVDHKGGSHPPLRGAAAPVGRVSYEVHRLRVEEVHLIVLRLEVAGSLYVAVPEDVETLIEDVARGTGHLHEG